MLNTIIWIGVFAGFIAANSIFFYNRGRWVQAQHDVQGHIQNHITDTLQEFSEAWETHQQKSINYIEQRIILDGLERHGILYYEDKSEIIKNEDDLVTDIRTHFAVYDADGNKVVDLKGDYE